MIIYKEELADEYITAILDILGNYVMISF